MCISFLHTPYPLSRGELHAIRIRANVRGILFVFHLTSNVSLLTRKSHTYTFPYPGSLRRGRDQAIACRNPQSSPSLLSNPERRAGDEWMQNRCCDPSSYSSTHLFGRNGEFSSLPITFISFQYSLPDIAGGRLLCTVGRLDLNHPSPTLPSIGWKGVPVDRLRRHLDSS